MGVPSQDAFPFKLWSRVLTREARRAAAAPVGYPGSALYLLQAPLVYVNTRMLQTVLIQPKWAGRMTPENYRGLTAARAWGTQSSCRRPPHLLMDCLGALERYIHEASPLPALVRAGLLHVQFETIHPFLDGNGRLGRLLITLFLCEQGALRQPLLYLSLHFKTHREDYYRLLQEVRERGTWEAWLDFFLQ